MTKNTFLIVDDDVNIRKMLRFLIQKENLGYVLEEVESGKDAVEEIIHYAPDILLLDFFLPEKDGIAIMKEANSRGFKGKVIMISQVEDGGMKAKAYNEGAVFFISKPINAVEVKSVINGVLKSLEMERSMDLIRRTLIKDNFSGTERNHIEQKNSLTKELEYIFGKLGIIGETGIEELKYMIKYIQKEKKSGNQYKLQDIYQAIIRESAEVLAEKTIEQRIRRVISKALENIAQLGIEDYYNQVFSEYSSMLFDFSEVRAEMSYLNGKALKRGKVNIRKFCEGIINVYKNAS